jgi:hypothetical protein
MIGSEGSKEEFKEVSIKQTKSDRICCVVMSAVVDVSHAPRLSCSRRLKLCLAGFESKADLDQNL